MIWIKDGKFTKLTNEQIEGLSEEEALKYANALNEYNIKAGEEIGKKINELMSDKEKNAEEIKALQKQLNGVDFNILKDTVTTVKAMAEEMTRMKEEGNDISDSSFKGALKKAWDSNISKFEEASKSRTHHTIEVKATQTYGDISDGEDFAQFRPGIGDVPVRMPKLRQLFRSIPVSTEFLKYTEQDTVVRDAQNVAKCAEVTSSTKETIIVRDIQTKVIKDQIDFCRLFISDYPFMESRVNKLLNESLALRVEEQILLGDGTGENTFSIDSVSSTFNAANPACDISASVQAATYVDLILGMETQIVELGDQNAYVPDTVLVNKCDWFVFVQSRKDLNNNYLDGRVTMVNGVPTVGGMTVVWSPLIPQNEVYVFDSTKGEIVDRQSLTIEVAFENKDNWEKEIATIKGMERLNFLVLNNNANAFMHAPDVAAAITAITAP